MSDIDIHQGDCLKIMRDMPDNSVDSVVTDPPYAINMMLAKWDKSIVNIEIWKECFRVLKSGGFAFIMTTPKQNIFARMVVNLEDAGFDTNFTSIYWVYAQGLPKAMNLSKSIDKKLGAERKITGVDVNYGSQSSGIYNYNTTGKNKTVFNKKDIPVSNQAKIMDGWYAGYQPKPALELIIVCQKPLKYKTYTEQAIDYANQKIEGKTPDIRCGGVNFGDCRIPHDEDEKHCERKPRSNETVFTDNNCGFKSEKTTIASANPNGRFPSHLLVSDCVLSTSFSRYFSLDLWFYKKLQKLPIEVQKTFPCLIVPKPSKSEKNKGCKDIAKTRKCRWNNSGVWRDLETEQYGNTHVSVKPLKLFCYLIMLATDDGDTVLDPFLGSGTTAVVGKLIGRKIIGIEKEQEYIDIARARVASQSPLLF